MNLLLNGATIPFARTAAQRALRHDPRLSIEERYASREAFVHQVRQSAEDLAREGYLLAADVEAMVDELDEIYRVRIRRGLGYRLGEDAGPGAGPHALGHVGGGGSFAYADPDRKFAVAFVKNYLRDTYGTPGGASQTAAAAVDRGVRQFKGGAYTSDSANVARQIQVALGV